MTGTCISTAEPEKTTLYMQWKHLKFTSVFLTSVIFKSSGFFFILILILMTLPLQYNGTEKINFVFLEKVAKLK